MAGERASRPLRILILADRDWTHPQGGGSGANLYAQVSRWLSWGHHVTVVAGDYPGARRTEQLGPNLLVKRMGSRATVFPRAIWAVMRGLGRDADVVLEVINGIPFFTPLWLGKPCVALVHHVHRELYEEEFGRVGLFLSWLLESLPFRFIYRRVRFLTISEAARRDLVREGIPEENITVAYLGVEPDAYHRSEKTEHPQLIYLGRLKQYKRIEYVLDVLETLPGARLDIVGDGDHRESLVDEIHRRGLDDRVEMHGHVDDARKAELYGRAWVSLTASSSEGWSLTVMEAALCGTPSAALAVGGLPESIVDGVTGVLAHDRDELAEKVGEIVADTELRDRLADAAEERARSFTWERAAATNLRVLGAEAGLEPAGIDGQPDGAVLAPVGVGAEEPVRRRPLVRSPLRLRNLPPIAPTIHMNPTAFETTLADVAGVEGWMTDDQARRLWNAASRISSGPIVEIGSFRGRSAIVLARAAAPAVEVVAIDPHAGGDRGPNEIAPDVERGDDDYTVFHANLARAGVDDRIRHVRLPSQEALDAVDGDVELLYVDGAHRYAPARDDIARWGGRVRRGGTLLIHDSFNAVGVTLAILRLLVPGSRWRYVGRDGSLAEYRHEPLAGRERVENGLRQLAQLPYFVRNALVKIALLAHARPLARLLGHHTGDWPY